MAPRMVRASTVVITGATSGIGRETAKEFARAHARVVVAGRREERLRELAAEIEAKGGEVLAVRTDVSDRSEVDRLIERAVVRFGRVDTLVNNAGVGIAARFEEQSLEDFRRVMETNFWGAVFACKAAVARLPAGGPRPRAGVEQRPGRGLSTSGDRGGARRPGVVLRQQAGAGEGGRGPGAGGALTRGAGRGGNPGSEEERRRRARRS